MPKGKTIKVVLGDIPTFMQTLNWLLSFNNDFVLFINFDSFLNQFFLYIKRIYVFIENITIFFTFKINQL